MKVAAAAAIEPRGLRVFVVAPEGPRRSRLEGILSSAGHEVAAAVSDADVVLADGDCPLVEGAPVVTLGSSQTDHAGSLDHDATPEQIDAALRAASAGLVVRARSAERGLSALDEGTPHPLLTPREMEVLEGLMQGLANKSIARRLEISLHTVKFHVESVFRKLGVRTRAEAVAKALERRRGEIRL